MSRYLARLLALKSENTPPLTTDKGDRSPSVGSVGSQGRHFSENSTATETPETRWPEYAAALKSGALVACVYCRHYEGPPDTRALGHCTAFDVEACPVTPFTCRRFERVQ